LEPYHPSSCKHIKKPARKLVFVFHNNTVHSLKIANAEMIAVIRNTAAMTRVAITFSL
jgi:hypothetical protein